MRSVRACLLALFLLVMLQGFTLSYAQGGIVTVVDVKPEAASVPPSSQFTVQVTVSYDFTFYGSGMHYEIRVAIRDQTQNPAPGGSFQLDQVQGKGTRVFAFNLIAPAMEATWKLRATVEYRYIAVNQEFTHYSLNWYRDFAVKIAEPMRTLTLKAVPGFAVSVAGTNYTADADGIVTVANLRRGVYVVSVPAQRNVDAGTRYVFKGWTDGDTSNPRSVNLDKDITLEAVYEKQYYLTVESPPYNNALGSGWYTEGSDATVTVPSSVAMGGITGMLGGKVVFAGWTGAIQSQSPTAVVKMNAPQKVTALWQDDLGGFYLGISMLIIGLAILLIVIFLFVKRRRPPPTPLITGTGFAGPVARPAAGTGVVSLKVQAPVTYCPNCGAVLPPGATKCLSCGTSKLK